MLTKSISAFKHQLRQLTPLSTHSYSAGNESKLSPFSDPGTPACGLCRRDLEAQKQAAPVWLGAPHRE